MLCGHPRSADVDYLRLVPDPKCHLRLCPPPDTPRGWRLGYRARAQVQGKRIVTVTKIEILSINHKILYKGNSQFASEGVYSRMLV